MSPGVRASRVRYRPGGAWVICEVAFARLQGLATLLHRFRDSPVAREDPRMQPIIIDPHSGGRASLAQVNLEITERSAVTAGAVQTAALSVAGAAASADAAAAAAANSAAMKIAHQS